MSFASHVARSRSDYRRILLSCVVVAAVVFAIDVWGRQVFAVGVGYGVVILLAARAQRKSWVLAAAVICATLVVIGYLTAHGFERPGEPLVRSCVGMTAIVSVAIFAWKGLTASETLRGYTTALDQAHDIVVVTDLEGVVIYWNKGATDLYGWDPDQALGRLASELMTTDVALPSVDHPEFADDGLWQGEIVTRSRDGRNLIVHCRCLLLRDDRHKPTGVLTTANDITARHEADLEIRRSAARSRHIFQATGVSIWECDFSAVKVRTSALYRSGVTDMRRYMIDNPGFIREAIDLTRVIDVNDATLEMFGAATKQDIIGPVSRVWPVESEGSFADSICAAIANVPRFVTEVSLCKLDGTKLDVLFSTAFPPESSARDSIFVAVSDLTARNEAQAALQATQVDLAHATRLTALGELTASIAHEVNQPLAGILSNAQASLRWIRRPEPQIDQAVRSLEAIVEETRRAGTVIQGIRALAKKQAPVVQSFDMCTLVRETLELLRNEIKRHESELSSEIAARSVFVEADRVQIQQVIINLVINGLQAMEETGVGDRWLRVECVPAEGRALISVSDCGPGIAPDIIGNLFTAFVTTKSDGMGLGLSVCSSIVGRHGGRIWADDAPGGGACMRFSLPIFDLEPTT
ncbi:sensor histidine kinase [Sphingomonas glacialis]|uniref:histidine kinase n=1 Tax=Sphingomonas glacialis TaxID=658225 RepID=A0A502FRM5_9SPHN|nr:ATP-binding protein [Sphingomonas glacialis]TPG52040.1 PAS domain S-box protein [Sphingomonas glacialis]